MASQQNECVKKVIELDGQLGKIRNHACKKTSLSNAIRDYVSDMEKLNFEGCPADFSKGFQDHKLAWLEMLTVTDKYPNLRGEMHDLFDQLEKGDDAEAFNKKLKSIWDTWSDIENVVKN